MSSAKPLRGEIWRFDLSAATGRDRFTGPCLIVSTNALNRSEFGTVILCPVTTTPRPSFRWRVEFVPRDLRIADADWAAKEQWVATDQIFMAGTSERAVKHLATVINPAKMRQVDESLRLLLDL